MNSSIVPWKTASAVLCVGVNSAGWNLSEVLPDNPEAPRTFSTEILFSEPFQSIPLVHAALSGFDLDQRDSSRLSLAVASVTTAGFTLAITTWLQTRVYGVEVTWLAIGS